MAVHVGTNVTDERVLRGSDIQQGVLQATELQYLAFHTCITGCRPKCPGGLRRGSAAARLLRLWVRIQPRAFMYVVSAFCCKVEVSASGLSLVQWSPTDCGMSEFDCEASIMRRLWHTGGCCAMVKKNILHGQTLNVIFTFILSYLLSSLICFIHSFFFYLFYFSLFTPHLHALSSSFVILPLPHVSRSHKPQITIIPFRFFQIRLS
jgi:hypothetical protein